MALDLDPRLGILAVEALHGLPCIRALVTLLAVDRVGNSPKLWAGNIVGKSLALRSGPSSGTRLSHIMLADHTTDIVLGRRSKHTIQAFLRGIMWSISISLALVQVAPS